MDWDRTRETLELDRPDRRRASALTGESDDPLLGEDLPGLRPRAEPGCQVHRRTDGGILESSGAEAP
ncbi:MAG: hypothetical protein ACREQQ_03100 [Candidatus Binatia bacterium]